MNLIRRLGQTAIFYIWRCYSQDIRSGNFYQVFLKHCQDADISLTDIESLNWVFDCGPEGHSTDDIKLSIQSLKNQGLEIHYRVIFSALMDPSQVDYPAIYLPYRLINQGHFIEHVKDQHIDWLSVEHDRLILCLMRRISHSRVLLAKKLLKQWRPEDLRLSLGVTPGALSQKTNIEFEQLLKPHSLPIVIDAPEVDLYNQHRVGHDLFYRSPINLVVETSHESDDNVWRSVFVTEKSYKAFVWHQLPIWYGVSGIVQECRRQGFDVFDDVFDGHQYDLIKDPWIRQVEMLALLKQVVNGHGGFGGILELRQKLWSRLQANYNHAHGLYHKSLSEHPAMINGFIYD